MTSALKNPFSKSVFYYSGDIRDIPSIFNRPRMNLLGPAVKKVINSSKCIGYQDQLVLSGFIQVVFLQIRDPFFNHIKNWSRQIPGNSNNALPNFLSSFYRILNFTISNWHLQQLLQIWVIIPTGRKFRMKHSLIQIHRLQPHRVRTWCYGPKMKP